MRKFSVLFSLVVIMSMVLVACGTDRKSVV